MNLLDIYQTVKRLKDEVAWIKARLNKISTAGGDVKLGDSIVGLLPQHTHQGTGEGGKLDHGQALDGLGDDDHPQYMTPAEHTAVGDSSPHHASVTLGDSSHSLSGQELSGVDAAAGQKGHVQLAGQLGGSAASPDVRGLRETAGPTLLTLGAIADGEYLKRSGSNVQGAGAGGEGHITIFPSSYNNIGQGSWEATRNESSLYDWYYKNETSPANGDYIEFEVYLAAGTYTLMLMHHKNTDAGILDIYFEATEVDSIDMYGSLTWNVRTTQTGIVVSSAGLKTIKLIIDGKNASSSDYKYYMVYLALWRTS